MKQKPTYGEMLEGTLFESTFYDVFWLLLKNTPMKDKWVEMTYLEKDRICIVTRQANLAPDYRYWEIVE